MHNREEIVNTDFAEHPQSNPENIDINIILLAQRMTPIVQNPQLVRVKRLTIYFEK